MKGRKPIPTAIKATKGDGIHDTGGRVIPTEPQSAPGAPPTPQDLDGDALLAWHQIIIELEPMGLLQHADRAALVVLAEAWAEMRTADRSVQKDGPVIQYPNGMPGPNPFCKIRDNARSTVMKLLAEFGMTPIARTRLAAPPPKDDGEDFF